jgi:two-component system chemotaxis sensor kinase CheA
VLSAHAEDDVLSFEVSDDGRGIDWDLIRSRGQSLGLPHSAPGELLRVLCHPGVTTRGEVSDTSGRGMGMAAFERCVRRMQGRMEVESSNLGTRWVIRFAVATSAHGEPSSGLYVVRNESGIGLPLAAG